MPKKEINLLPQEEFEKKTLGKFLLWALTAGRWIVVITNIIVLAAFFSRFKLDSDVADLKEEIRTKQAVILASASFEKDFRALQNRLSSIEKIENNQLNVVNLVSSVSSSIPADVVLTSFSFKEDSLSLSGIALSPDSLGNFSRGLSRLSNLTDLNLSSVSKNTEGGGGIKFNLTAQTKR